MRRPALILLLAVLAVAAVAVDARASEQVAASGPVRAVFSYQPAEVGATDLRLAVTRNGQPAYDEPVTIRGCEEALCGPGAGGSALSLRDLDGDGEPEVILDLFTGGAHCCSVTRILRFDGTRYVVLDHDWGDPGYRLGDLDGDGRPELISADPRFAYAFSSYAASLFPPQIWTLRAGRLVDVTRRFPRRIARDARRAWRVYRAQRRGGEPRGAIAAWAADRYLLGRRAATLRTLRRLARAGRLPGSPPRGQRAFVARLDRFLRRAGYAG